MLEIDPSARPSDLSVATDPNVPGEIVVRVPVEKLVEPLLDIAKRQFPEYRWNFVVD